MSNTQEAGSGGAVGWGGSETESTQIHGSQPSNMTNMTKMARDILAVPISTVASESAFSAGGRVLDSFRSSLTPKVVEALICGQDWLRGSRSPISVEELIEEVEKFEKDLPNVGATSNI